MTIKEQLAKAGFKEISELKIDFTEHKFKMKAYYHNDITERTNSITLGKQTIEHLKSNIKNIVEKAQQSYDRKNQFEGCMYIDNVTINFFTDNNDSIGHTFWSFEDGFLDTYLHEKDLVKLLK